MRSAPETRRIEGWGYSILLALLFCLFLLQPWASHSALVAKLIGPTYGAILIGALFVVAIRRLVRVSGVALVVMGAALGALAGGSGGPIEVLGLVCGLAAFLLVIGTFLGDLLRHPRVTVGTISGSICVYAFLGIAWTLMYTVADLLLVDAFQGLSPNGGPVRSGDFFYFSFVTLTTLGYGNVTPARPETWSMATLEALVGQLYLVVLVATFIGRRSERVTGPSPSEDPTG